MRGLDRRVIRKRVEQSHDLQRRSEQAFGAQKSGALPLAGSGKWSMISRTLSKLGRLRLMRN